MDVVLYKGTLQKSTITFGLIEKRKILGFEKGGKHLVPRDKNKQLIELPEDIDLKKIKKNSKESIQAIEFYLNNPDLEKTAYGAFLIDYYINEISKKDEILEELDDEGKNFFKPFFTQFFSTNFLKNSAFHYDYYKESKVISRYCLLDLELVFSTIIRDVEDLVFKDKQPIAIFPMRYSTREVKDEDLNKISELVGSKLEKWFTWRKVIRKAPYLFNYIVNWIHQILEKMYPEDNEAVKDISEDAERAEVLSNVGILNALQQGEDFEADTISQASLNKHILYYLSMQFLFEDKQLSFKKYQKTLSFGYHDILISMANIYTSIPLFTTFNPPFSMIAGGLIEWIDKDLSFQALQGNRQLDPYNIIPNAFSLYLSIVSSKSKILKERKYLLAKSIEKILTPKIIEEGLKWQKQTSLAMQGKDATEEEVKITVEDLETKQKEIHEKLDKYVKSLRLRTEKKTPLDKIIETMETIDKDYEEMKDERDNFLKIEEKYKTILSDFQKDFILSTQLFETDETNLNTLAQLFDFINKYIVYGSSSSLYGFAVLIWFISITQEGSWKWIGEKVESPIKLKDESKTIANVCTKYNTSLQGMLIRGRPLIETTAPTIILQMTQNLSELLITKDISKKEKYPFYSNTLKYISEVYSE
jgi:hypothetical protein